MGPHPWDPTPPMGPAQVELNRLNDMSNYISHLKEQHMDNPDAAIAAARLEKALMFAKIGDDALNSVGVLQWDPDNEVRAITDMGDAFEPSFELGTDEHAAWVKEAKEKFE